jgi:hypothetical protein
MTSFPEEETGTHNMMQRPADSLLKRFALMILMASASLRTAALNFLTDVFMR